LDNEGFGTIALVKTAIVYDRVNKWGGAERVLLALHEMFPKAPLYTSVYNPKTASWAKVFPKVIPSFLQKIPFAKRNHELLAPLMPIAFETFDFSGFDLAISVTSEAAKGIIGPPIKHICYCLTPTRYLWSHYGTYFKGENLKAITKPVVSYLRYWDKIAAHRPDELISISTVVRERVKKYYSRNSRIIFPPVEIEKFQISSDKLQTNSKFKIPKKKKLSYQLPATSYYLVVSRLVPYKRVDLAIEVFNKLGYPLVIVGTGSQEKSLKKMANENIKFAGYLTDSELVNYYSKARALIMPQEEDFGIVAVEAQAAGVPVIAYNKGGSLDTVIDPSMDSAGSPQASSRRGATGVFFDKQSSKSLISAIGRFEKIKFNKTDLISNAKRFSKERFKKEFQKLVNNVTK
jgi:glycosyltransferase involved in cell wall biosynthesis